MRNKVQNPIISCSIRAVLDLSSVADTDWHDLSSSDFIDSTTGSACASGLSFEWLGVENQGSAEMFIKYRPRTLASDPTTNEIAVGQIFSDDLGTLRTSISTIAYKKNSASDVVRIIVGLSAI
jgi:hypothetical protein